jgi:hypothetical protein
MPHRIEHFLTGLRQLEFITLNLASFGWIFLDMNFNEIVKTPTWVSVMIGLSIVFFNVARGIAILRNKKK